MAEQYGQVNESQNTANPADETKDRGMFSFFGKKDEEKPQEQNLQDSAVMADQEDYKLNRTKSSSSSSSEEEVEEGGMKIRRKKKKAVKDKLPCDKNDEPAKQEVHAIPVEHHTEPVHPTEEKKGLLDKLKEKMPGHNKKDEPVAETKYHAEDEGKEKKGILEKIKDKLPGGHKDGEEAKKDY